MGWLGAAPAESAFLLYLGVPLLGLLLGTALLYWIYDRQWGRRGARWFVAMVGASVAMTVAHVVYLLASDPQLMHRLLVLQAVAGFVTLPLFAVFVSVYTDRDYHRHTVARLAIGLVAGGVVVLAATDPFHDLLFAEVVPVTDPFPYLHTTPGVGFVAVLVVAMGLVGYSWYALVVDLVTTQHRSGLQLLLVLLAGLAVAVADFVGRTDLLPAEGFHHAVWGLLPFAVLTAVALFRLRLFDVQPVARNAIVEDLHDPILVLDRERRVVDYNRASVRLWPGIDGTVGVALEELAPAVAAEVELPSGDDRSETTRQLVRTVDGEDRHYSVTVSRIRRRYADRIGWYAVLFRDVTTLERSRRQLQRQNERLDQVAGTISHDLRNPIQIADGYASLLEDEIAELAAEPAAAATALSHLSKVDASLSRMDQIVGDLLALARGGRTVEEVESVALESIARQAWTTVETARATLEVAGDRELAADRSKLLSVFENLFRNAVEHAGPDATVEVGPTESGFYVQDDGPGIASDEADDVFEYGHTASEDGTGFGLAIVRTIAETHGWTVDLDAGYGSGARFVFDLGSAPVGHVAEDEPAAR